MNYQSKLRWSIGLYYPIVIFSSYIVAILEIVFRRYMDNLDWRAFYGQERFEINSRRLFRLAAELINETGDGFTERPFSAGKAEFTKDELQGFSRFLNGRGWKNELLLN